VRVHHVGVARSAELGGEIVRAEREREHVRRLRDRLAMCDAARGLDDDDLRHVAGEFRDARAVARARDLGDDDGTDAARCGQHRQVALAVGRLGRVHPDRDGAQVGVRVEERAHLIPRVRLAVRRDRVLEVEDRAGRTGCERFSETLGAIGRYKEQKRRIESHGARFALDATDPCGVPERTEMPAR